MTTLTFKLPVAIAKFPFDYVKASRAILRPELDVVSRAPVSAAGTGESLDHNILQLLHCENMMPVDTGMRAVGFYRIKAAASVISGLKGILPLFRGFVMPQGFTTRYATDGLAWQPLTGAGAGVDVSTSAVVGTRTFVMGTTGATFYEVNPTTGSIAVAAMTLPGGYTAAGVLSICGAGNYLIAMYWTSTLVSVLWSSLTNPLDFTDTTSGAGRATPNTDIGVLVCVRAVQDGFIIFGRNGAIGATATNDASRPFTFRPIPGSLGVAESNDVPFSPQTTDLYVKPVGGIQKITLQRAEFVLTDAADFLRQSSYSVWAGSVTQQAKVTLKWKLTYLMGRYVIMSYNGSAVSAPVYDKALVFDTQLNRFGHINKVHAAVYASSEFFTADQVSIARICFVAADLTVDAASFDTDFIWTAAPGGSTAPYGIAVFGHIKGTRGRMVTFQQAVIDGTTLSDANAYLLPSIAGHARSSTVTLSYSTVDGNRSMSWRGRHTADNFDLALIGRLDLTTILVEVTQHGSR